MTEETGLSAENTMTDADGFAGAGDLLKAWQAAKRELVAVLRELPDPFADATTRVSSDEILDALRHLDRKEVESLLQTLRIPLRRATQMAAQMVLAAARRGRLNNRVFIAQRLTAPVRQELDRAYQGNDPEVTYETVAEKWPQGLRRLAAAVVVATDRDGSEADAVRLLCAPDLVPTGWVGHTERLSLLSEAAVAARRAHDGAMERLADTDEAPTCVEEGAGGTAQETTCEKATPSAAAAVGLAAVPETQALDAAPEQASQATPADASEASTASSTLEQAWEACRLGQLAAQRLGQALQAGSAGEEQDLGLVGDAVTRVHEAIRTATAALREAGIGEPGTIADLDEAAVALHRAAELRSPERLALNRLAALQGVGDGVEIAAGLAQTVSRLRSASSRTALERAQVNALVELLGLLDLLAAPVAPGFRERTAAGRRVRDVLAEAALDPDIADAVLQRVVVLHEPLPPAPSGGPSGQAPVAESATHPDAAVTTEDQTESAGQTAPRAPRSLLEPAEAPETDGSASTGAVVAEAIETPVVLDPEAATDNAPVDERQQRVRAAIGDLLAAGLRSGAYWTAVAGHEPVGVQDALRFIALATAARGGLDGPASQALHSLLEAMPAGYLVDDPAIRLVAVPAAIRACLLAPYSGIAPTAAEILGSTRDLAPLDRMLAAAIALANGGGSSALLAGGHLDFAAAERGREAAVEAARAFERASKNLSYHPQLRLWQALMDGMIGQILRAVIADDINALSQVRDLVVDLGAGRSVVERFVRDVEQPLRSQYRQKALDGTPRKQVLDLAVDVVRLGSAWVEACTELRGLRDSETGESKALREAQSIIPPAIEQAGAALERVGSGADPAMVGAVIAGRRILDEVARVMQGERPRGEEAPVNVVLARDLLGSPLRLSDKLRPLDLDAVDPFVLLVAPKEPAKMLEVRRAMGDHVGAGAACALAELLGDPAAAELRQRRNDALAEARRRLAEHARRVRREIEHAHSRHLVSDEDLAEFRDRVDLAEDQQREDLEAAAEELDAVAQALEGSRSQARQALVGRLDAVTAESDDTALAADALRVRQAIEGDDLATAEDLILVLESHEPLPAPERRESVADFFPAVIDSVPDGITPQLVEAARTGGRFGALDFGPLDGPARSRAAGALSAWRATSARTSLQLTEALRVLGIEVTTGEEWVGRTKNHRVVPVRSLRVYGKAFVPHFGSRLAAGTRLLLCWESPPETKLLDWANETGSAEQGVIALYFGTMSVERRLALLAASKEAARSSRAPILVIDDAVMALAAAAGGQRWSTVITAALPFSALNPYVKQGILDGPEMFYGRNQELKWLSAQNTHCLVYGGRQLGKSSLLRAVVRDVEGRRTDGADWQALHIDVRENGVTRDNPDEIWPIISRHLESRDIISQAGGSAAQVSIAIEGWIAQKPDGRLLLLLDECDGFFEGDSPGFDNTRKLKGLMDRTHKAFKPVFAGLHSVQRFGNVPNQPFAHLEAPIVVGPLRPQHAYNLIDTPLSAMGYRLAPELVHRIQAMTANHPALLQIAGHALVENLLRQQPAAAVPVDIGESQVTRVLNDESFRAAISDRFDKTLALDDQYRVIAYVAALAAGEDERDQVALSARDLQLRCRERWPAAFDSQSIDAFRTLLQEMVDLGVLAVTKAGRYRLRSSNLLTLIGDRDRVNDQLEAIRETNAPPELGGLEHRPHLSTGGLSPLSDRQLGEMFRPGNRTLVVVATTGLGADDLKDAISDAGARSEVKVSLPDSRSGYERSLDTVPAGKHQVVVDDVRHVTAANVPGAVHKALTRLPQSGASRTVVLAVPPSSVELLLDIVNARNGYAGASLVGLRRYTASDLREFPDIPDADVDRVLGTTGGWPILVQEISRRRVGADVGDALGELARQLADPEHCKAFLEQVGLAEPLAGVFETASGVLDIADVQLDELTDYIADEDPMAGQLIPLLCEMQVLDVDRRGVVTTEPVVHRAWRTARKLLPVG